MVWAGGQFWGRRRAQVCTDYPWDQRATSKLRGEKAAGRVLVAKAPQDGEEEEEREKEASKGRAAWAELLTGWGAVAS